MTYDSDFIKFSALRRVYALSLVNALREILELKQAYPNLTADYIPT
jgi:hypothetical protein